MRIEIKQRKRVYPCSGVKRHTVITRNLIVHPTCATGGVYTEYIHHVVVNIFVLGVT